MVAGDDWRFKKGVLQGLELECGATTDDHWVVHCQNPPGELL